MNIWENAVITQQGFALQSKLIAGNTLDITKIQIGTGTVSVSLLYKQTALQSVKKTLSQVTSITYPEEGKCAVKINITNDDVTTGYTAQQIGFFADDPDDGEILYFIAQAESGQGTVIPSKTEMPGFSTEWTFTFQYGQADNVSVTVDPSNTVSQSEMESYLSDTIDDLKGGADGLASLGSDGKIPTTQLPAGEAGGVASLDSTGKIPESQIPSLDYIPTSQKGANNGVASLGNDGKVPTTQLPEMDYVPNDQIGQPNGIASLDSSGKVPADQLPAMNYIPTSEKGAASGVATLDSSGKLTEAQLPDSVGEDISAVQTDVDKLLKQWVYLSENYAYTCQTPADTSTKPYTYTETVKNGGTTLATLVTTCNADGSYKEVLTVGDSSVERVTSKSGNTYTRGAWS